MSLVEERGRSRSSTPAGTSELSRSAGSVAYTSRTAASSDREQVSDVSLAELGQALQALVGLSPDWDGYGASAPSRTALEQAWRMASVLAEHGVPAPQPFPTRRGGVQLEWHVFGMSLEWELDPDGASGVFIFDDLATGETAEGELPGSTTELVDALVRIWSA